MLPSPQEIQIVLPIVCCIFLILSLKRSVYGAISYFIIVNAKLGEMYPVLGAIRFELLAAIIVLTSIFIQSQGLKNILPKTNVLNKSLWIYFTLGILSVLFSIHFSTSWNSGGYTLIKLMLFYIMVVASVHSSSDLNKIIWSMILITAWIAYEPYHNYITGNVIEHNFGDIAYGRFGAATGHVALANTLSQGIPLAYYWAISQKKNVIKLMSFVILALLVVGVVITKSRGGFIGLAAIAIGIAYLSKNRVKTGVILALCFICLLPFAGQDYLTHMSTITGGISQSRSTTDRYMGLLNGISMMFKRPILGVGLGCYAEARKRYFNYYFFSHNLYGELLGELGLASISWFIWIYLIFKKSHRIKKIIEDEHNDLQQYINVLNAVQVGLFVRLVIGNFSHCQMIWFWYLMAALTISINFIVDEKQLIQDRKKE